jgi:peptide deformylase
MSKNLKIVELGDKILRAKAKPVSVKDIKTKKFENFCNDLIKTCDLNSGVGIASPQVGQSKRMFILWSRNTKKRKNVPELGPLVIINPKIISTSKKILKAYEGCLSVPGIRGIVPRYESMEVEFINREGKKVKTKFQKFPARIFQHEFDHLNGIVFLDRADSKNLITEKEYKKLLINKKK